MLSVCVIFNWSRNSVIMQLPGIIGLWTGTSEFSLQDRRSARYTKAVPGKLWVTCACSMAWKMVQFKFSEMVNQIQPTNNEGNSISKDNFLVTGLVYDLQRSFNFYFST